MASWICDDCLPLIRDFRITCYTSGARGVEEFPPIEGSSAGEEPPTPEEAPATPEEAPAGDIEVPPAAESHAQI